MAEKPILFNGPMVRAILEGRKTQTRRIVNLGWATPEGRYKYGGGEDGIYCLEHLENGERIPCPKPPYLPGDRLWVRETWAAPHKFDHLPPRLIPPDASFHYAATEDRGGLRWRPNIHMPRSASRITLEVTDVLAEQVQDISEEGVLAEGLWKCDCGCGTWSGHGGMYQRTDPIAAYQTLWDGIYGPDSWESNPWVWAISFKVLEVKK